MGSPVKMGSDCPSLLMADTSNWYRCPGFRPCTVKTVIHCISKLWTGTGVRVSGPVRWKQLFTAYLNFELVQMSGIQAVYGKKKQLFTAYLNFELVQMSVIQALYGTKLLSTAYVIILNWYSCPEFRPCTILNCYWLYVNIWTGTCVRVSGPVQY